MTTQTAPPPAAVKPPLIKVQSGPRNARTDPATGLRFYTWQGRELPSVTTVRRMAGLPHGLHQWAIGKVIDAAVARSRELYKAAHDPNTDPARMQVLRAELRAAAVAERDAAADLGTRVHDAAAAGLHPADVLPDVRPRLAQYLDWLERSGAVVLASEFQVWNPTVGYAGTADLLVRFPSGATYVVDIKTGKGVYGEHALQLMAYLMAEWVGADGVIDEEVTGLLRSADGMAVLHLSDTGWEFDVLRADLETWTAFRGLLAFAGWMRLHEPAAAVITGQRSGGVPTADDGEPADGPAEAGAA